MSSKMLRFALLHLLALAAGASLHLARGETVLLDRAGVDRLLEQGIQVSESGRYGVWAWARAGAKVRLKIGPVELGPASVSVYRPFSWRSLGAVPLEAGRRYDVALLEGNPAGEGDGLAVGGLALSPEPGFDPLKAFQLMRISDRPCGVVDARTRELRRTRFPFEMPDYASRPQWSARRGEIRRKMLVSAGLWPMPSRRPIRSKVVGTIRRDGYVIEKLYFQTRPGVYFPGSLYRPADKEGPLPAVMVAHGHTNQGRMSPDYQALCATLARKGYLVFAYNMIGYVDNDQMDHHFQDDRAYLWSVSVNGLQLFNSIRVLDFLTSLPEADPNRIACTGSSGGGTQTYQIAAVDDRVAVSAPVCMVSSFFQGGCICENGPGLRLDTYNVEIAACAAPRPQILVATTGDWTRLTPEREYPDVLGIYRLLGAEDKLTYFYQDAPHNYNEKSRAAVYRWLDKWLMNPRDVKKLDESGVVIEPLDALRVFGPGRPRPDDALSQEAIVQQAIDFGREALERIWPRKEADIEAYRRTMGPALADVLNVKRPQKVLAQFMPVIGGREVGRADRETFTATGYVLSRPGVGDQIPAVLYRPLRAEGKGGGRERATLVVHPEGKAALVDPAGGQPGELVKRLLRKGRMVLAIDTFLTGEHHGMFAHARRERYCQYFSTFNAPDDALRVQDIVTAITFLEGRSDVAGVDLVGVGEAGLWCLLAAAFAPELDRVAADAAEFANRDESAWIERLNIPGVLRVGGFDTAAACFAGAPLLIHDTDGAFDAARIAAIYKLRGVGDRLAVRRRRWGDAEIADWITQGGEE